MSEFQKVEDIEAVSWTVSVLKEFCFSSATNSRVFHPILKGCVRVTTGEERSLSDFTRRLYPSGIVVGIKPMPKERGTILYEIPDLAAIYAVGAIARIGMEIKRKNEIVEIVTACKRAKAALESIDQAVAQTIREDLLLKRKIDRSFKIASISLFLRK